MIVYISIGNSDDKLSQQAWAEFIGEIDLTLVDRKLVDGSPVIAVHGRWFSAPDSEWQNACWCAEIEDSDEAVDEVKSALRARAREFDQDSIAWAVAETEFLRGADG